MGRKINRFLKSAVVVGGLVTAFQAAQTTKKETGGFAADKFVGNFKTQAAKNIRFVADAAKPLAGKYFALFTGKSGKKSAVTENETLKKAYETAKAVAPEAVEKVEEYVDVQKNAPEYQAQAEKAIDDAAESAIKFLDLEDEKEKEEEKPEKVKKADKEPEAKKAEKAKKADKESEAKKPEAKKAAKAKKADEEKK